MLVSGLSSGELYSLKEALLPYAKVDNINELNKIVENVWSHIPSSRKDEVKTLEDKTNLIIRFIPLVLGKDTNNISEELREHIKYIDNLLERAESLQGKEDFLTVTALLAQAKSTALAGLNK